MLFILIFKGGPTTKSQCFVNKEEVIVAAPHPLEGKGFRFSIGLTQGCL